MSVENTTAAATPATSDDLTAKMAADPEIATIRARFETLDMRIGALAFDRRKRMVGADDYQYRLNNLMKLRDELSFEMGLLKHKKGYPVHNSRCEEKKVNWFRERYGMSPPEAQEFCKPIFERSRKIQEWAPYVAA